MARRRAGDPDPPATPSERVAAELAALKVERSGYVARGLEDRVRQVDEQIRLRQKRKPATAEDAD